MGGAMEYRSTDGHEIWAMGCSQQGRAWHKTTGTNMTVAPCPLCHHPDGGTHTLAGCQHPRMKAQYILRHDQAVAMIMKAIKNGKRADAIP